MQKKTKNKKIELFELQYIEDDIGQQIERFINLTQTPIWAYFRQVSNSEYFAAKSIQSTEEVVFVINWRKDISTYVQIKFEGKFYDITRIDCFEGGKNDLKLYAKAIKEK